MTRTCAHATDGKMLPNNLHTKSARAYLIGALDLTQDPPTLLYTDIWSDPPWEKSRHGTTAEAYLQHVVLFVQEAFATPDDFGVVNYYAPALKELEHWLADDAARWHQGFQSAVDLMCRWEHYKSCGGKLSRSDFQDALDDRTEEFKARLSQLIARRSDDFKARVSQKLAEAKGGITPPPPPPPPPPSPMDRARDAWESGW